MTSKKREESSPRRFSLVVPASGKRLDQIVTESLAGDGSPTRSQVAAWIEDGRVTVDGTVITKTGFRPKAGGTIYFDIPPPRTLSLTPDENISFSVVHEESSFLVINKPPGLVVHPGAGRDTSTLVHGLLHHLGSDIKPIGDAFRPGLVHRLDKDTSGLMVIAKTEEAFRHLTKQLKAPRTMSRRYLLVSANVPRSKKGSIVAKDGQSGVIELPIGRSPSARVKMSVVAEGGREARTFWKVQESFERVVLCEVELETGRTHQIRVHFQAANAPILGDPVYGAASGSYSPRLRRVLVDFGRQALHAYSLAFLHPITGERVSFQVELPDDMLRLIEEFRKRE